MSASASATSAAGFRVIYLLVKYPGIDQLYPNIYKIRVYLVDQKCYNIYMSNLNIIDNFLSEEEFESIHGLMMGSDFPWYFNNGILVKDKDDTKFQFTHTFYMNSMAQSNFIDRLNPIFTKISANALIRVKSNLQTRSNSVVETGLHTDTNFPCTTAIFYINTNNGYTAFEDGTRVDSVANRLVSFDSNMKHSGTTHTDTATRVLINFNYI
jgi:hypothetical protein